MPQMDAFFNVSTYPSLSLTAILITVLYIFLLSTVFYKYSVKQSIKFNFLLKHLVVNK